MHFQVGKGLLLLLLLSAARSAALEDGIALLQVQQQGSAEGSAEQTGLQSAAAEAIYDASQARLMRHAEAFSLQQAESFNRKLEELALANVSNQERGLLLVQHSVRLMRGDQEASEVLLQLREALSETVQGKTAACYFKRGEFILNLGSLVGSSVLAHKCIHVTGGDHCVARYLMLFEYTFFLLRSGVRAFLECAGTGEGVEAENALRLVCRSNQLDALGNIVGVADRGARMSYTCQRDFSYQKLQIPKALECGVFSTTLLGAFVLNLVDVVHLAGLPAARKLMLITNEKNFWEQRMLRFVLQLGQFTLLLVNTCFGKGGWGAACALESVALTSRASRGITAFDAVADLCYDVYGTNWYRKQLLVQQKYDGSLRRENYIAQKMPEWKAKYAEIKEEYAQKEKEDFHMREELRRLKKQKKLPVKNNSELVQHAYETPVMKRLLVKEEERQRVLAEEEMRQNQAEVDRLQKILQQDVEEKKGEEGARQEIQEEIDQLEREKRQVEERVKEDVDRFEQEIGQLRKTWRELGEGGVGQVIQQGIEQGMDWLTKITGREEEEERLTRREEIVVELRRLMEVKLQVANLGEAQKKELKKNIERLQEILEDKKGGGATKEIEQRIDGLQQKISRLQQKIGPLQQNAVLPEPAPINAEPIQAERQPVLPAPVVDE